MLEIANLEVVYNDVVLVLRGLSLEVKDGQIVALLGANGAGKTTTLRAITGLLDVHEGDITKGSIDLAGERIDGKDASVIVKSGIAQVMEGTAGLCRDDGRRESANGFDHQPQRGERQGVLRQGDDVVPGSRKIGEKRQRAISPAASSRCSPSAGR